ncbi:hypothetical protein RB200_21435 [Streptomyces sp. PmtG]
MTQGETPSGEGAVCRPDARRARLLMAYEAYALSEFARAAVPVTAHALRPDGSPRHPGAALAEAAQVCAAAARLLRAAVVYERLGGADWQLIGDVLDVPPRTASERYGPAEARLRAELSDPDQARDDESWWRPHALAHPREAALDLDDWVLRHADGEEGLGRAPVSGALPGP